MKIAVDSGPLEGSHAVRGIGFYTKNLILALKKLQKDKNFTLDVFDFSTNPKKLSTYDIAHYPYFDLFFHTLPASKPTKTIVTIHDVIPLIYPKHYPAGIRGKLRFLKQKHSLKTTSAVITDSESSKKDIVRFLKVPNEKIFPIHLASAPYFKKITNPQTLSRVSKKYSLPKKFVLYVGDINYNKNIINLVKAAKIAKLPLVIVGKHAKEMSSQENNVKTLIGPRDFARSIFGKPHPEIAHYKKLKEALQSNKVILIGFVTDKELVALYNLACESFATIADATDPKKLGEKLLKAKFKKSKVDYSWEKTARKTYNIYKKVFNE